MLSGPVVSAQLARLAHPATCDVATNSQWLVGQKIAFDNWTHRWRLMGYDFPSRETKETRNAAEEGMDATSSGVGRYGCAGGGIRRLGHLDIQIVVGLSQGLSKDRRK